MPQDDPDGIKDTVIASLSAEFEKVFDVIHEMLN